MKNPRLFRMLIGAVCGCALTPVAPAQPVARLGSTVFQYEKLAAKPTGTGERRDVTDGPTATLGRFESHLTTLLPGRMSHAPHQHPQEEVIILRQGTLDVTINGVTTRAGPARLAGVRVGGTGGEAHQDRGAAGHRECADHHARELRVPRHRAEGP